MSSLIVVKYLCFFEKKSNQVLRSRKERESPSNRFGVTMGILSLP